MIPRPGRRQGWRPLRSCISIILLTAACTPASVIRPPEVSPGVSTHLQAGAGAATGQTDRWFWLCSGGIEACILADTPGFNGELAVNYGFTPVRGLPWSIGVVGNGLRLQAEAYGEFLGGPDHRGGAGARVGIPVGATRRERSYQLYGVWTRQPVRRGRYRVLVNPTVSYRSLPLEDDSHMTALMITPAASLEWAGEGVRLLPSLSLSYVTGVSTHPTGEPERYHSFVPMLTVGVSVGRYD